jgi:tetratricopeptide (TPR) repeat protein
MSLSSAGITRLIFIVMLLAGAGMGLSAQQVSGTSTGTARNAAAGAPAQIFRRGQDALASGNLDEAERCFRQVLGIDSQSGAAYANLGVVYMRRKQWSKALADLQKAKKLMPQVPGVRLNIGLAYYRQNEFLKAIPEFEVVAQAQPDAAQLRFLLGQCYFFADRWADAVAALEPLWEQESGNLQYLYMLSNAAYRAGRKDLDERASTQLLKVGEDSSEYQLIVGEYYLSREEYDPAMKQFEAAAKQNPVLPFVHFYMGRVHMGKQEYAQAREEFLKDAAIEPDVALNYEEIGNSYWLTEDDVNAEKNYRMALGKDPKRVNSMLGLAKIYQRREKYQAALAEADAALKVDPERTDAHYVRGQMLLHLGRNVEAKKEMTAAAGTGGQQDSTVASPELMLEPR